MRYTFDLDLGNGYQTIEPPQNAGALSINMLWNSQTPSVSVSGTDFEFTGKAATLLNQYRAAGLTGGYGIYYAPRLKITHCDGDYFILDLDIAHPNTKWECETVSCPVRQSDRVDWFDQLMQGVTFSYLASAITNPVSGYKGAGQIFYGDFKKTPYAISEIPDATTIATLQTDLFLIAWQISEMIRDWVPKLTKLIENSRQLSKFVGTATAANTPVVGVEEFVRLALQVAGIALDITALYFLIKLFIDTFKDLLDAIIQPKKYKLCMREADMWVKVCDYAGLQFSSPIYGNNSPFQNATWMPKKIVIPTFNGISVSFDRPENEGADPFFKAYGHFDGTGKEFVDEMCRKYNATYVILNGVLYFNEKHNHNRQTFFTPPNIGEMGNTSELPDPFTTNAQELPFEYVLQFQVDDSELNTLHKYKGTTAQVSTRPVVVRKKSLELTPPGQVIILNEALGKRKEYLTVPETLLKNFEDFLNNNLKTIVNGAALVATAVKGFTFGFVGSLLIDALGIFQVKAITDPDFQYPSVNISRIGWLLLSADGFSVPKTFIGAQVGDDWQVDVSNEQVMSAEWLMQYYHWWNLGTDYTKLGKVIAKNNQHLFYANNRFSFCCKEYNALLNSNYFKTPDGKDGYIVSLNWNLQEEQATDVVYKINTKFVDLQSVLKADGQ